MKHTIRVRGLNDKDVLTEFILPNLAATTNYSLKCWDLDDVTGTIELEGSWSEHERDMKFLSEVHPCFLFVLYRGDEDKYFHQGCMFK